MAQKTKNPKDSIVFIHTATDTEVRLQTPSIVTTSEYPSEWFKSNKRSPTAKYFTGGIKPEDLPGVVRHGIHESKLNVNIVKYLIHDFFKDIIERCVGTWVSFGQQIAVDGQEISPWNIVRVTAIDDAIKDVGGRASNPSDVPWMVCLCLSAHRLNGITNDTYSTLLKDKIFEQIKLMGSDLPVFPPRGLYDTWTLDPDYNKMVAAIDMFLVRFPKNPLSIMRLCTLRSRYKDCAGLLSISYLSSLLNLTCDSMLLDWLFTEKLAEEAIWMMKNGEEIIDAYSYFPYQSDMGLVQKTYYSATKNPHMFFLIHAVGTLLQTTRSKNAKYLSDFNVINNSFNAKVMPYAFAKNVNVSSFNASSQK